MAVKKTEEVVKIEETKESMAAVVTETKEPVKVEVKPVKVPATPKVEAEEKIEVAVIEKRKTEFFDENKKKITGIQLIVEITVGDKKVTRLIQEYI